MYQKPACACEKETVFTPMCIEPSSQKAATGLQKKVIQPSAALDQLESRIGFMAARGIDLSRVSFSTSFGRGVDYYTGFEFELHRRGNGVEPLVAGGR